MKDVVVLILAAGSSSRMRGADKLLQEIDGVPLLRRQAMAATRTGLPVVVILAPDRPARRAVLGGMDLRIVEVDWPNGGMAASIRAGIAQIPHGSDGAIILPADMPDITSQDLHRIKNAFAADGKSSVVRGATRSGALGHPVLFPKRLFHELENLTGDRGARGLLAGEQVIPVTLPGRNALTDLDTPEDWNAWRASRQSG